MGTIGAFLLNFLTSLLEAQAPAAEALVENWANARIAAVASKHGVTLPAPALVTAPGAPVPTVASVVSSVEKTAEAGVLGALAAGTQASA